MTARPIGQSNGDVVTEFVDVADTGVTTWTYQATQNSLNFTNRGNQVITVNVGGTGYTVNPGASRVITADFTSFTTQSASKTQEFKARASVLAMPNGVDMVARAAVAQKADKSYVDTALGNVGDASPKEVFATLAALQSAYPTGKAGLMLVTADGKVYFWNGSAWTAGAQFQSTGLADGSITPEKTNFVTHFVSDNLLNPGVVLLQTRPLTTVGSTPDQTEIQTGFNTCGYVVNNGSNSYALHLNGADSSLYVRAFVYTGAGYQTNIAPTYSSGGVFNFTVAGGYIGFRIVTGSTFTDFENSDLMIASNWTGVHEKYGLETNTVQKLTLPPIEGTDVEASIIKLFNPLYEKKIAWFGDSLTDAINKTWAYHVPLDNRMTTTNYAVSGSAISYIPLSYGTATTPTNCITKAIETYASSLIGTDYIIFSGGFNDGARGSGYPNGALTAINDFTGALDFYTFYGALEQCCRMLLKTCLGSKVGFIITPNNPVNTGFRDNKYPAIKATLEKYSIPYIDLYKMGGLTPGIPEVNNTYFKDDDADGVADKTHPKETGYTTYLNDKVTAWLKTL